jgi:archaemetzincin
MTLLGLLPLGDVAPEDLDEVERVAAGRLACRVRRLPPLEPPAAAHDRRRGQWDATCLLREALGRCPPDAARLLAVTDRDIFIPVLTFVFGQAQLAGPGALLSLARLRPQYHGGAPDRGLFTARLRKETVHELGHTLGLTHCADRGCVMALSVNVAGIDRKREDFCRSCGRLAADRLDELRRTAGAAEV